MIEKEVSEAYKKVITETWKVRYQLVPPHVNLRNAAEQAIWTFKVHFLSVLAGVDSRLPGYLWDTLLPKAELMLNIQFQATLNLRIYVWEYFHVPLEYYATPLGPMVKKIVIHNKNGNRKSWDQRDHNGFNAGPDLEHQRCFLVIDAKTKSIIITDAVEFLHSYITQPTLTHEDKVTHAINMLTCPLVEAPAITRQAQLEAIYGVLQIFEHWRA